MCEAKAFAAQHLTLQNHFNAPRSPPSVAIASIADTFPKCAHIWVGCQHKVNGPTELSQSAGLQTQSFKGLQASQVVVYMQHFCIG